MKLRNLSIIAALALATALPAEERKVWSLQDCIEHALSQNIQLQQNRLSLQSAGVDVSQAKAALFPSLSFSSGQNLLNRPFQETSSSVSGTEIISSDSRSTYSGNYQLGAQWTLWDGGKRRYNIKQKETEEDISELTVEETQNQLKEEITRLYVQILYAAESVDINRKTLETSQATLEQAQSMFEEGDLSKADVAQLEAQMENDRYQLVTAENALKNYKLQLKQLLELDGTEEMELEMLTISDEKATAMLPAQADVYSQAVASRPEIKSSRLSIENAQLAIKTAKAGYMPTISLSAATSTQTNSGSTRNWGQQLKLGWNNSIGLQLNIPIFNQRETKSAVEKAEINYSTSQLDLADKQKELYATIESLWLDAQNAQQQFLAADSKLKSTRTSFEMVSEQFSLGIKNTVELLTEKNNMLIAQQQRIQAKYMAVLDRILLDFYAGEPIRL
jgi:outer membrane protein